MIHKWDLLIAFRVYLIFFLLIYPAIYFFIIINYFSQIGVVIIGLSVVLILKYVLLEARENSPKFLKVLMFSVIIIVFNFVIGFIICLVLKNMTGLIVMLGILVGSAIFFIILIFLRPLKAINLWWASKKENWLKNHKYIWIKKRFFKLIVVSWLIMTIIIVYIPYPIYVLSSNGLTNYNQNTKKNFGIWTYGQNLDDNKIGQSNYIDNETLQMLGDAGVYFIYGLNKNNLGIDLINRLDRCKDYGIEVHLAIGPLEASYTNIWSFDDLENEIEEILAYLSYHYLIGDPITTLVYDMETMTDTPFPFYGFDSENVNKLNDYYEIQEDFNNLNERIRDRYQLNIKITSDVIQAIDYKDGDDDLMNLWGIMSDENAEMSYMVYRRYMFGQNQILHHCRFLNDGDTIILNAWKHPGYLCWKNIACAIKDARLVLGYNEKEFKLEIWELSHFIESYGIDGLYDLVDAVCEDLSDWAPIIVWNTFSYSFYWETIFYGIVLFDLYSPLFRFLLMAY